MQSSAIVCVLSTFIYSLPGQKYGSFLQILGYTMWWKKKKKVKPNKSLLLKARILEFMVLLYGKNGPLWFLKWKK